MTTGPVSRRKVLKSVAGLSATLIGSGIGGARATGVIPSLHVPLDSVPHKRTWMAWPRRETSAVRRSR